MTAELPVPRDLHVRPLRTTSTVNHRSPNPGECCGARRLRFSRPLPARVLPEMRRGSGIFVSRALRRTRRRAARHGSSCISFRDRTRGLLPLNGARLLLRACGVLPRYRAARALRVGHRLSAFGALRGNLPCAARCGFGSVRARCRSRNTPSLRCARLVRGGISSDAFRCAAISRRRCGRNRAAHRRGSASLIRCGYISIVRVYFHRYFLSLGLRIISGYRAHYYVERAECEKRR